MKDLVSKSVRKGKWRLKYSQYLDEFGIKNDSYNYEETKDDGSYVNYPACTPMRVQNHSKDTPIDLCNEPTKKEMLEDLEEFMLMKTDSLQKH